LVLVTPAVEAGDDVHSLVHYPKEQRVRKSSAPRATDVSVDNREMLWRRSNPFDDPLDFRIPISRLDQFSACSGTKDDRRHGQRGCRSSALSWSHGMPCSRSRSKPAMRRSSQLGREITHVLQMESASALVNSPERRATRHTLDGMISERHGITEMKVRIRHEPAGAAGSVRHQGAGPLDPRAVRPDGAVRGLDRDPRFRSRPRRR
jgi:hypothetical protein